MRILAVHNRYQQRGGEDLVYEEECALLEQHGHQVIRCEFSNDEIKNYSAFQRFLLSGRTTWSTKSYHNLERLARQENPDVAHFHNTLPLISPAGYYAVRRRGCAVVQTLHNYRLTCLNGLLLREGRPCEACVGKAVPWPGVVHACYRDSRAASVAVATMLTAHRALGTWSKQVDAYIALTALARQKFIEGGLPPEKLVVKPNFVYPDPGPGTGQGRYALFVGRLSKEKGIETMLAAWQESEMPIPLKIVGDGPEAPRVAAAADQTATVQWLKRQPLEVVYELMGEAVCLLVPSIWYEGLPRTIVESFARATPVIASNLGAMSSLIEHGRTGLHFEPGNADELASQVRWFWAHPDDQRRMRRETRAAFEATFTAERNYEMLMAIYETAMARARRRRETV